MMSKKEIAEKIMDYFRKNNSKPGHLLSARWLDHNFIRGLNPKEVELLDPAIQDLVNDGLIEIDNKSGAAALVLKEKGFDHIYPMNEEKTINDIQRKVMQKFEEQKSKIGHVLAPQWLSHNLFRNLNPKELALAEKAIQGLIDKQYISHDVQTGYLRLESAGYETLYN